MDCWKFPVWFEDFPIKTSKKHHKSRIFHNGLPEDHVAYSKPGNFGHWDLELRSNSRKVATACLAMLWVRG